MAGTISPKYGTTTSERGSVFSPKRSGSDVPLNHPVFSPKRGGSDVPLNQPVFSPKRGGEDFIGEDFLPQSIMIT